MRYRHLHPDGADGNGEGEAGAAAGGTDVKAVAEELARLKEFNARAMNDLKKAQAKLKGYEGLNPDEAREAVEARRKAEEEAAKAKGDWETREKQLRHLFEEEKKPLVGRAEKLERSVQRLLVDARLTEAIAAEQGLVKALLPMLKTHVKVVEHDDEFDVEVVDEKGKPLFANSNGDPMTIRGLVQRYKADAEYAGMFLAAKASGGGSDPAAVTQRDQGGAGVKTIRADDQAAFLANMDKIAKGEVRVVVP
jgi:hypothetical protein